MAEVLGGIQTAEAITGLITATCKVIKYCRKLADAHRTAEKVLQRISGFEETLKSVKLVLEHRKELNAQVVPQISPYESTIFEKNIHDAAERCKETLESIQKKLEACYGKDEAEMKLRDRQKLLKNTPDIHADINALETHKSDLNVALVILNIHDQSHGQAIASLRAARTAQHNHINVRIDVNALPQTSHREPTSSHAPHVSAAPDLVRAITPILDESGDGKNTATGLEGLQPVQQIADHILNALQTTDNLAPEDALRHTPSLTRSDSTIDESEPTHPPTITPPQVPATPDEDALREFISDYAEQGRQHLEACHYAQAESSLSKAVEYTKILKESTSIPLSQLVELFENLAKAKAGLRYWNDAISIIQDTLINSNPVLACCEGTIPLRKKLITARHCELLGSVYLDKYLKDSHRTDDDWTNAHNNAQQAWQVWSELEKSQETTALSEDQSAHLHECLLLLVKVFKAKDMDTEAQYYARQLRGRNSSVEKPHDDANNQFRPRTMFSISKITNPANLNIIHRFKSQEINGITALREAVDASDEWTLIQLLGPAPFGCNISIDEQDEAGTALHHATRKGDKSMIVSLLTETANIDAVDDRGNTALSLAVYEGDAASIEILLKWNDGKVNKRTRHDREGTLLHTAVKRANTSCTELLLVAEPGLLDQDDRSGQTALHYCAESGLAEQAAVLIDHGADLNKADATGRYPLHLALGRDDQSHEKMVKLLLTNGASTGYKQLSAKQQKFYDRILNQLNREQDKVRMTAPSTDSVSTRTSRATSMTTTPTPETTDARAGKLTSLFRMRTR